MIQRKEYLDNLLSFQDKQLIKVVTGIRRCGKSTLLVHRCTNSRVTSTRYPRHLHACEASRRPHYAVASQTHS